MFRRVAPSEPIDITKTAKDVPVVNFTEKIRGRPKKVKEVEKVEEVKKPKEVKEVKKSKEVMKENLTIEIDEPEEKNEIAEEPKKSRRLVKGSPEAMEWAKKMAEKRKLKSQEKKKVISDEDMEDE